MFKFFLVTRVLPRNELPRRSSLAAWPTGGWHARSTPVDREITGSPPANPFQHRFSISRDPATEHSLCSNFLTRDQTCSRCLGATV
jgi:hypothetical protein